LLSLELLVPAAECLPWPAPGVLAAPADEPSDDVPVLVSGVLAAPVLDRLLRLLVPVDVLGVERVLVPVALDVVGAGVVLGGALTLAEGLAEASGLVEAEALAEGEALSDGDALTDGEALSDGDALTPGEAEALVEAPAPVPVAAL